MHTPIDLINVNNCCALVTALLINECINDISDRLHTDCLSAFSTWTGACVGWLQRSNVRSSETIVYSLFKIADFRCKLYLAAFSKQLNCVIKILNAKYKIIIKHLAKRCYSKFLSAYK
jgi:hypothetical protein